MQIEVIRRQLADRLRERRPEIEEAVLTRIRGLADPAGDRDPLYREGLRIAVAAAIEYGLEAVGRSEDRTPPIPIQLLSQARLAARNSVSLDTVLRRYFAGYTLLGDFLIEEAQGPVPARDEVLKRLLRALAAMFDRVVEEVSNEYAREAVRPGTAKERRVERVRRLLDGEPLETGDLGYELQGWHLAVISNGAGAMDVFGKLARSLDHRTLIVPHEGEMVWAWLGSRSKIDPAQIGSSIEEILPASVALTIGEPGEGLSGWRLSHLQARAAFPIALRNPDSLIRYADVALLASVLEDGLLAASLRQLYLLPLSVGRDGGEALRETLRAYFAADRNVSSAAAALGVSRKTVMNRLHTIEERFDRPLGECATQIEVALTLEGFGEPTFAFPTG